MDFVLFSSIMDGEDGSITADNVPRVCELVLGGSPISQSSWYD